MLLSVWQGEGNEVNLTLAVTSCLKVMYFTFFHILLDRTIMPDFKRDRRTRNMVNRANDYESIISMYLYV